MPDIDLEGLQDFADAGDRDVPPYFAGRNEILDDIGNAATRCWNAWKNGQGKTPGATRVIHGAPGAGKSSLLMHLERTWAGPGGGAPAMLRLGDPADFMNGRALAERLANLLRPGTGASLRTEISRSWHLQGSVTGVGGRLGRASRTGIPDDPINAVLAHFPGEAWTSPVMIAVDEFQTAAGDKASPHAMVLRKLHTQDYAAPIMVLLAGLSDTIETAERLGVSRRAVRAEHSLGALSDDDVRDLVVRWGLHYGLAESKPWEATMLELAEAGSYWPTHVHNSLAAFAEEIVRVAGDMGRVDMARAAIGAHERRQEYYEARMSAEMKRSKLLLGAVMADFADGLDEGEVVNLVNRHADPASDDVRWHLPEGMGSGDYYRHILHRGVIQEEGMRVRTPIPSFRRWIIENCTAATRAGAEAESGLSVLLDPCRPSSPFDD